MNWLGIFARAPNDGRVKTRLAAQTNAASALLVYRHIVQHLCQRLKDLPNVRICFTPDEAASGVEPWLQPTWVAQPQGQGNLGERLVRTFRSAFESGIQRAVVIGSDCPEVEVADIEAAWTALHTHDLVLGPAEDGGYWLVGLRALHQELFNGIPWSTPAVLKETLRRSRRLRLTSTCLRTLRDIDTLADWDAFTSRVHTRAPKIHRLGQ